MTALKPKRTGMITARTLSCNALTIAASEAAEGYMVSVCAACITDAGKAAIEGLPNLSHGLCDPCLDFAFEQVERHGRRAA